MEPNPYEAPKETGYRTGKPVMAPAAKWMACGAFSSLLIGGLLGSFLPKAMFGFPNLWLYAIGLAAAMWLAVRADRYPRIPG